MALRPPPPALVTPTNSPPHAPHHNLESLLSYDSDEEPPAVTPTFSWRLPPEESRSDWEIKITVRQNLEEPAFPAPNSPNSQEQPGTSKKATLHYHVHKCLLAAGNRKCTYFARLFQQECVEAKQQLSRIKLHTLAAVAFPHMLDYMYQPNEPLTITTQTATALHNLGQYFGNRSLRWDAKQFWKNDLAFDKNLHIYYEHAKIFEDDKVLEAVAKLCAMNLLSIPRLNNKDSESLLHVLDADFWPRIFAHVGHVTRETSLHVSGLVVDICRLKPDEVDADLFALLTNVAILPIVQGSDATELLTLHDIYLLEPLTGDNHAAAEEGEEKKIEDEQQQKQQTAAASSNLDNKSVSCLQQRCISALAEYWRGMALLQPDLKKTSGRPPTSPKAADLHKSMVLQAQVQQLEQQPSHILTQILLQSLACANDQLEGCMVELSIAKQRVNQAESQTQQAKEQAQVDLENNNAAWERALELKMTEQGGGARYGATAASSSSASQRSWN